MKKMIIMLFAMTAAFAVSGLAQPRPADTSAAASDVKPAPETFEARYEGGLFGFSDKEKGKLKFDDANERIVFYSGEGKEWFGIPYSSILVLSPQSRSVTSTTGNVIRHIPLPGAILGGFIKEKRRYLIIQYEDPDVDVKGMASFKLEDKELLDSVLVTLGKKAGLTARGDAFYRPRDTDDD